MDGVSGRTEICLGCVFEAGSCADREVKSYFSVVYVF